MDGSACIYGIISQMSIYNWGRIAFYDISDVAFPYFKDQIWTCCDKSDGVSHE